MPTPRAHVRDIGNRIVRALSDDLRRAPHKGDTNRLRGHCYVASEALYYMADKHGVQLRPMFIRHEGAPHWFLMGSDGEVYDLTAGQFGIPVPYSKAKGKGFLTSAPSARAAELIRRASQ